MKKHRHATIVMSPPARRRGLKRLEHEEVPGEGRVASRAEAWIETIEGLEVDGEELVASRAEAWIETGDLPRRIPGIAVASRAEAWIETRQRERFLVSCRSRLPRGGVD